MARTPEIGQGLGRILSCGARKPEQTYDYCGLRTTTLFHDILILPQNCQQVKEDNLPLIYYNHLEMQPLV